MIAYPYEQNLVPDLLINLNFGFVRFASRVVNDVQHIQVGKTHDLQTWVV